MARVESADVNTFIKSVIWSVHQAHWIGILKHDYGQYQSRDVSLSYVKYLSVDIGE